MARRSRIGALVVAAGVVFGCGESKESAGDSNNGGEAGSAGSGTGGTTSGANSGGAPSGGSSNGGTTGGGTNAGGTDGATGGTAGTGGSAGARPNPAVCEPLSAPTGAVVEVTPEQADELPRIVRDAGSGTTISLADGTYRMSGGDEASRRIQIVTGGVTLRGGSGDRDAVIIDGEYLTQEIVTVSASNVTLADLTIQRAINHPVHVMGGPNADTTGTRLRNLRIVDGGEQFVKINTSGATPNTYADDGSVECSSFELTDAGRPHVVPDPGGCYTGGIDGHQARGWVVRGNLFVGIHCTNGSLSEHAIHFWTASRDTLVEENSIIDCARGIGFGLGDGGGKPPDRVYADDPYPGIGYVGHYDGVIRNNVIAIGPSFEFFDTGIELEQAHGARVLHNTVIHPENAFASISHRFANTRVTLENNLVRSIRARDGSTASGDSNLENAADELFLDISAHNLHLVAGAAAAIDQGIPLDDAGNDIDGSPHESAAPDLGADEFEP